ncbi:MAG TPA: alpha/beta hydrolase-fold protein [Thermoguttaceae bacterium]|nr:alpha/beta hydrolase-fold protein [Thermoguttaceae bacterium]
MNRIQQTVRPPEVGHVEPRWDLGLARFSASSPDVPHTLFAPQHYETHYAYPLIVWLHGPADDERQLLRIMPLVSMRNYVAVAPRGTVDDAPGKSGDRQPAWTASGDRLARIEQRVFDSIGIAWRKYHVSPRRVFVAGFDTGGTMAFHLALNYPQHFAGVLSLGGAFPRGQKPFRRLDQSRHVGVFLAAGRDSASYTPNRVCDDLRLLHSAGMSITLRQYPCGHELCPQMLQDMDRWVIEQITNEAE